jgi:hypothetical protein
MWYLNLVEMKLTKQRLASNGGYRQSLKSWILLVIAYLIVFSVLMVVNPWGAL